MARLLIVHHTPSPTMHTMFEAVLAGATDDAIEGVDVTHRAALAATATDVLAADAYILGTPANLGYISGALKHFFDTVYYPCLAETRRRPYGLYLHGNNDVDGAVAAVDKIVTGLGWLQVQDPVTAVGEMDRATTDACWELGASVAAGLTL